jgi:hypothetical protein
MIWQRYQPPNHWLYLPSELSLVDFSQNFFQHKIPNPWHQKSTYADNKCKDAQLCNFGVVLETALERISIRQSVACRTCTIAC